MKAFIAGKRAGLVADINAMFVELGRADRVTDPVIDTIMESFEKRLTKAQGANFMPTLTYSAIAFERGRESSWASPWGQAYAFLNDVARLPRRAFGEPFFAQNLTIDEELLLTAMNVADDALLREDTRRGIRDRSKTDLRVLKTIEQSSIGAREKCELVYLILSGGRLDAIVAQLRGHHDDSESKSERDHLIAQLESLASTPTRRGGHR